MLLPYSPGIAPRAQSLSPQFFPIFALNNGLGKDAHLLAWRSLREGEFMKKKGKKKQTK